MKDRLDVFERPVGAKSYLMLGVFVHAEPCVRWCGLSPGVVYGLYLQGTNRLRRAEFEGPIDLSGVLAVGVGWME